MKLFLIAAILCAAILAVQSTQDDDFKAFKGKHKKKYKDAAEEEMRFKHFKKVDDEVKAHNARLASGLETYAKGHNHFSDMSDEEKKVVLGRKSVPTSRNMPTPVDESLYDRALPAAVDYRVSNCLTAVKNQGNCGDCYVFASVTPIEYQYCVKYGTLVTFSEQHATDCTYPTADGCQGGLHEDVFAHIASSGGLAASSAYPFVSGTTGTDTACKSPTRLAKISSNYAILPANETLVQSALATYGPISIAMDVTNNFMSYSTGIFTDTTCGKTMSDLNHEMVLVGYGDLNGTPYWVVRNSWGTSWGQSGYALVRRGVNMCGIVTDPGYPTVL